MTIENDRKKLPTWLSMLDITLEFDLYDAQVRATSKIMKGEGCLVILPTGMGKTILGVIASKFAKEVAEKKSILLTPLRALTSEHVETFQKYGLQPLMDTGEHRKSVDDYDLGDFDVVISTYEKMDALIRNYDVWAEDKDMAQKRDRVFDQISHIIIDEIHTVEDNSRGVNLESFIMCLKRLYPHITLIGLSATIGNYKEFAEWMGVDYIYEPAKNRPVPLQINYIELYSFGYNDKLMEKLSHLRTQYEQTKGEKRMIAVTSVRRTRQLVQFLAGNEERNIPPLKWFMKEHKMAWHYSGGSGMSEADRMAVEWAFQLDELPDEEEYYYEGIDEHICRKDWLHYAYNITEAIDTVVCTPTLIVGRNLPVTYIDVFDVWQYSYRTGPELIGANRLQQTIGRAGRLKFAFDKNGDRIEGYKGIATIYCPADDITEVQNRAENPFNIESKLLTRIGEKMLAWINSRIVTSNKEMREFLQTSFLRKSSHWSETETDDMVKKRMKFLSSFKFVTKFQDGKLEVTKKGRKTIKYYIQPETVVHWGRTVRDYMQSEEKVRLSHLIIKSMEVQEFEDTVRVADNDVSIVHLMSSKLNLMGRSAQAIKGFIFCFPHYAREKMNLSEEDYIIPDSEAKATRTNFARLATALSDIYGHTKIGYALEISKFMLESGVFSPKLGSLMSVRGIGMTYGKRLLGANINSKKEFFWMARSNKKKLVSILGMSSITLEKILKENNYGNKTTRAKTLM